MLTMLQWQRKTSGFPQIFFCAKFALCNLAERLVLFIVPMLYLLYYHWQGGLKSFLEVHRSFQFNYSSQSKFTHTYIVGLVTTALNSLSHNNSTSCLQPTAKVLRRHNIVNSISCLPFMSERVTSILV